jgi:hypothetical protein
MPSIIQLGQLPDRAVAAVDDEIFGRTRAIDFIASPIWLACSTSWWNTSGWSAQYSRIRGSWARFPVDLGFESSAILGRAFRRGDCGRRCGFGACLPSGQKHRH